MLTAKERQMLDALVLQSLKLDTIFGQVGAAEPEKGACATYSRVLCEVFGEFKIKAVVRPVLIETANRVAIQYLEGKITLEEAEKQRGKIQVWGDIREGQAYQHAVCFIDAWNVVIDLAMTIRASGLVPSHPYWLIYRMTKTYPWWFRQFQFMTYPLEYRGYETNPEEVEKAKEVIREVIKKFKPD